jgi:large subunit ribosomal protein L16
MLIPKNRKYRKAQKSVKKSLRSGRYPQSLTFGSYGLKALNRGWLKASQLEAVRRVLIRHLRNIGKIWIRVFPDKPISQKPTKTRMGKGKGSVQFWVCPVAPGRILFEIKGSITQKFAKDILQKASQKLPILTKFVTYNSSSYIYK